MINSTWIVAPEDVANQNFEDVFYLLDIQKGIQINGFISGTPDINELLVGLNMIMDADVNEVVTFHSVSVTATSVTKDRVKVMIELINAGLISHS